MYHKQPMIPTFVFGWPTGKETGDFLALDLGRSLCLSPVHVSTPTQANLLPFPGHYRMLNFFLDLALIVFFLRRHKSPCLPGDPPRLGEVRNYPIKISPFGRAEKWGGPEVIRFLR